VTYTITMDTGGTFSDLVLADDERVLGLYKAPTTPRDIFAGVLDAITLAADDRGLTPRGLLSETGTFIYSTTQSTNAILTGATARTAFVTTEGHRDILVYREGGKQDPLNIAVPYPEPYVPRELTFELCERILADGSVAIGLEDSAIDELVDRLAELEVEAVGVCLLWSVVEPAHELRVGARIRERLPGVEVTLSHELNPIIREYRRASATVIDASIKPLMRSHLRDVDLRLREHGFRGAPLMVTHLSGGVLSMDDMSDIPIHSVDSGPALAPVAGLAYAAALDIDGDMDVVVVDAGGTSFDVSATRDRQVIYSREKWLGPVWTGHMTGLPAVDTRSVGAGGGSVALVDAGGLLTVGPQSAGADPGPACYGRGGREATVTDAAVVLGYIDPSFFLGGRMKLDAALAAEAVKRGVAEPLDLGTVEAAAAIMTVFTENIRAFLAETMVTNGIDPRRSVLVAGGGAAGLNIVRVARELEAPQVLVPLMAAGLSAVGGQYSDIVASFSMGCRTLSDAFAFERVNSTLAVLDAQIDHFLARAGAGPGSATREFFCEARYAHQVWELNVALGDRRSFADDADVAELHGRFDRLHQSVFAVNHPSAVLEAITWRGDARVARPKPGLAERAGPGTTGEGVATRQLVLDADPLEVAIHQGGSLTAGCVLDGPVVIEEPTTTIVVPERARVTVHGAAYLIDVEAR
jgi:N-methylhydantoinase A